MSKHTPGPWRVVKTRIRDCEPGIDCIATMQVSNQPNWEADARLIAAAPELLEALQCAAQSAGFQYMANETRAQIDTAIAKATG